MFRSDSVSGAFGRVEGKAQRSMLTSWTLVAAFATGLSAIIGSRERAAAVILATVIGAIVTLFVVGEVLTPH
jgi:hypothetical protein